MRTLSRPWTAALVLLTLCPLPGRGQEKLTSIPEISRRLALFAPAEITADLSKLPKNDRDAIPAIIGAARIAEEIYLKQTWGGNDTLLARLAADTSEDGRLRLRYFHVNMGPWSVVDGFKPFIADAPNVKSARGSLYPQDMYRRDWGPWFIRLSTADQAKAAGPHTVIRRDSTGMLTMVPYSTEYAAALGPASEALTKAAGLVSDTGTRKALIALATAFTNDDYASAEEASLLSRGPLSVMIEPSDKSVDGLFYYKRGFEAVVGVRNAAETERLKTIEPRMAEIGKLLGAGPETRPAGVRGIRLRVDDAIFLAGGARVGALGTAVRLPSLNGVPSGVEGRTTLLRNVHEAKFRLIQKPIADSILAGDQAGAVTFEAFFLHLMTHELSHRFDADPAGLQVAETTGTGSAVPPADPLVEARADAAALAGLQFLVDQKTLAKKLEASLYPTLFSSLIRALRFGLADPYSRGAAIQMNYYMERQAVLPDPGSRRFRVDAGKMKLAAAELFKEITAALADPSGGKKETFMSRYAVMPPGLTTLRESLTGIPYDLEPSFPAAD